MSILIKNVILNDKKQDVYIENERIKRIGKLNLKAKEKIDAQGEKLLMPGFVNCHTHSAMIFFRGLGENLDLKNWLEKKIWPLEAKLTEEDVYWGTKMASLEMIKTGTTCFNEMYFYRMAQIKAVKEMGLRATIGLVLFDLQSEAKGKKKQSFFALEKDSRCKVEKEYQDFSKILNNKISFSLAPHAIYTVSKENLIWAKNFAKKNNLIIHIHLSETEKEVKDCFKKYKLRPVQFLDKINFLGENTVLAHSVWLSDKEIEILGKRKSSVVFNPCSNLKLAVGNIFPYKKMKEKKVNIALGTDGSASNNSLDMIQEMKFASLIQKHKEKDAKQLPAKEVLKIATLSGAKALKIDSGSIKLNKLADLILIDLNKIYFQPGHDFYSDLVYSASGDCVSDVICGNRILMRNGKIGQEETIRKKAASIARKLTKK